MALGLIVGFVQMIIAWSILGAITLPVFLRFLNRLLAAESSLRALVVLSLTVTLLGPGLIVPSHSATAAPVIIGMAVDAVDATPFHLFSWNLAAYAVTAGLLLCIAVGRRYWKQRPNPSSSGRAKARAAQQGVRRHRLATCAS
jgi:hypothetical protein